MPPEMQTTPSQESVCNLPSMDALRAELSGRRLLHVFTAAQSLRFLRGQTSFWKSLGVQVSVVAGNGPELAEFASHAEVHPVAFERKVSPFADLERLREVESVIRKVRPHIVHGNTPKGGLISMLAAAPHRKMARVYQMRGLPMQTASGLLRQVLKNTERVSCGLADVVICNSPSLREVAIHERLAFANKMRVLLEGSGNGVDSDFYSIDRHRGEGMDIRARLGIAPDEIVFGFVGRLARDKGMVELLEAWKSLSAKSFAAKAKLMVVGDVDERDALGADVLDQLRRDPRVCLTGKVKEPAPFYAAMNAVVLPSYREGFPNVPLEAAAMSLPVITTLAEGCRDSVVNNRTGLLVPIRNAQALGEAMQDLLQSQERRIALGNAGRVRAQSSFRSENIWRAQAALYIEVLRSKKIR